MRELLAVALGGSVGAVLRYLVSNAVLRLSGPGFPWPTMSVNVVGCLGIGLLLALIEARPELPDHLKLFLVTGLLGSFTTFSTFGAETLGLLRLGQTRNALLYVAASVLVGLLAVAVGRGIGGSLTNSA